jgi:hypothetical protein
MSAATQLKNLSVKMAAYFNAVSLNLTNTANALPSFEDSAGSLDYDEILNEAILGANRAASYSTGALTDTVHQIIAITREFDMRTQTKAAYITAAINDSGTDAVNYQDLYGRYVNYFRGTAPEQGSQ